MPSKADFQDLIDWCSQSTPIPFFNPVAGAVLRMQPFDDPGSTDMTGVLHHFIAGGLHDRFDGTLTSIFVPGHRARFQVGITGNRVIGALVDPRIPGFEEGGIKFVSGGIEGRLVHVRAVSEHLRFELFLWPTLIPDNTG